MQRESLSKLNSILNWYILKGKEDVFWTNSCLNNAKKIENLQFCSFDSGHQ